MFRAVEKDDREGEKMVYFSGNRGKKVQVQSAAPAAPATCCAENYAN